MEILKHKHYSERYGYIILLICFLLMLALFPFFNQTLISQMLFNIFFSLILVAALYTASETKVRFVIGLSFLIPSLVTRWVTYFSDHSFGIILNMVATLIFLCFIIFFLSRSVFSARKISINMIYGTTCIYIVLGVAWGELFALIDFFNPEAFSGIPAHSLIQGSLTHLTFRFENLLYYSFVTLTTLGYGDITPLFPGVKFLSILEAITGQIYIATSIARAVGLYLARIRN